MRKKYPTKIECSKRISRLVKNLYASKPRIESSRAMLLTESYKQTEDLPIILRRAKAFSHILKNIPIVIRDDELIVGSTAVMPRSCQTFPEYSFEWLEAEFDTVSTRVADPFEISEETKQQLKEVHKFWKGRTTSELASSYMASQALLAIEHKIFTPGNYFYNGVGHVSVDYGKIISKGFNGVIEEATCELAKMPLSNEAYCEKSTFLEAVIISAKAAIIYTNRYANLAEELAQKETDGKRKEELIEIASNCRNVPAKGATSFYEACQSFWFVQMLIQVESSGHSISPGRFDQYLYQYFKKDFVTEKKDIKFAQELVDCIWVKFNDINKVRDRESAEGFAGYSAFQNLVCGGQDINGSDATNELSYMCIIASHHVFLPQPSLSIRVWNKTPHDYMVHAAKLTRTGIGLPAYYNDEVIIPALMNRGLSLEDARDYSLIGCVEPQRGGKTDGWHDAAFFNMCRPLELVFESGFDKGVLVGKQTPPVEKLNSFEAFYDAYTTQVNYAIELMVNAINAIDIAHGKRAPLPFLSCMIDDCVGRGKSVQEGGAVYNFTGPQGVGIANMADSLYVIKKLVFEEKKLTLEQFRDALTMNYGETLDTPRTVALATEIGKELASSGQIVDEAQVEKIVECIIAGEASEDKSKFYNQLISWIDGVPKYGNDNPKVDAIARKVAYSFTRTIEKFKNPRDGYYQAGLYPVSANVPMGAQTGATPDGRRTGKPVADGVSPSAGKDTNGPTAAANSVANIDHAIASNGTLFNQKFHPSALQGNEGIENFVYYIHSFFDKKGSHMQFNVVDQKILLDAQEHPENYAQLIVRVAGYSALFTNLSRTLQDDIIGRTEQMT